MSEIYVKKILDQLSEQGLSKEVEEGIRTALTESFDKLRNNFSSDVCKTIVQLLGFTSRWQKYLEIDHCNNRGGNSLIMDELRPILGPIAAELVNELVSSAEFKAKFRERYKDEIRQSFEHEYDRAIQQAFRSKLESLRQQAYADVDKLWPHLVKTIYGKDLEDVKADLMIKMITNKADDEE